MERKGNQRIKRVTPRSLINENRAQRTGGGEVVPIVRVFLKWGGGELMKLETRRKPLKAILRRLKALVMVLYGQGHNQP